MHSRLLRAVVVLLVPLGAAAVLPGAAHADGSGTVVVHDRVGDVSTPRLKHPPAHRLTMPQKRSIDIRSVSLTTVGGDVQVTVALGAVLRPRRFDQVVHVAWTEQDAPGWGGDVYADSRAWRGSADYHGPGEYYAHCKAPTVASAAADTVRVTVPYRCVPVGPLSIRVDTLTGRAASDAPVSSRDSVRVPGRPVLDDGS